MFFFVATELSPNTLEVPSRQYSGVGRANEGATPRVKLPNTPEYEYTPLHHRNQPLSDCIESTKTEEKVGIAKFPELRITPADVNTDWTSLLDIYTTDTISGMVMLTIGT